MTDTTRFAIPLPEDGDAPNAPAQLQTAAERIETLLGYAGAQSKKSINVPEQNLSNASYALMGTPDRCQSIVLPTDGLIVVSYQALVRAATGGSGQGKVALFLDSGSGGVQLKNPAANGAPVVQELGLDMSAYYSVVCSGPGGLVVAYPVPSTTADSTLTGTGLTFGGTASDECLIRADAGTYTVSVQFKFATPIYRKESRLFVSTRESA